MAEDAEGIRYFGNNNGLLVYDGERWHKVELPNGSTVRSLLYASDGRLYAGGYNEIGTVQRDEYGQYFFQSILSQLSLQGSDMQDVWQISEAQGYIIFRSFDLLIALADNKSVTLPATDRFGFSSVVNGQFYITDGWGLKRLDLQHMKFEKILPAVHYAHQEVSGILPGHTNSELVLFTKPGYVHTINPAARAVVTTHDHLLKENDQIFSTLKANDGRYYLGTINNRIITLEQTAHGLANTGNDYKLQDNTVLGLYQTANGNIWALLNKGLDCIQMAAPVTIIFEGAAVYDAIIYQHHLYLATNRGVYRAPLKASSDNQALYGHDFEMVDKLEAQAWSLSIIKDQLIVAHDKGVWVVDGAQSYKVEGTNGIWKVIPIAGETNKYFACAYDGLLLLAFENGRLMMKNRIEGFDISSRDISQIGEEKMFWICHGYKGVYRIKLDDDLMRTMAMEHYTEESGLPGAFHVNLSSWQGENVFTTRDGIYSYVPKTNRFIRHQRLTKILGANAAIRALMDGPRRTWFLQNDELGYFEVDSTSLPVYIGHLAEVSGALNEAMPLLLPTNNNRVLIGTNNGLYRFDLSMNDRQQRGNTRITEVRYTAKDKSTKYVPLHTDDRMTRFPHHARSIHFQYATPSAQHLADIQYSHLLENAENEWSEWTEEAEIEYNYLKHGHYTFKVRSRSALGNTYDMAQFEFEINPPWYLTALSKAIFTLLAIVLLFASLVLMRRIIRNIRLEEQKMRRVLELELQQMKLEQEKKLIIQDKQKLEYDVVNKSKELANYTMLLVNKKDLLNDIEKELSELKKVSKNAQVVAKIKSIARSIKMNLQDEGHLRLFDTNFEKAHQEFFHEIKTKYPDLTQKELRLCGFVKMNLTNKEIASILNISVRGVETARYRLRKRLSIHHDVNMVEFLEKVSSTAEEGVEISSRLKAESSKEKWIGGLVDS
jgi:DNA-binding CsgD family transcriptional regulator/ligand-binding sensor domain-containing protein